MARDTLDRRRYLKTVAGIGGATVGVAGGVLASPSVQPGDAFLEHVERRYSFGTRLKSLTPYWYLIALPREAVVKTLNHADERRDRERGREGGLGRRRRRNGGRKHDRHGRGRKDRHGGRGSNRRTLAKLRRTYRVDREDRRDDTRDETVRRVALEDPGDAPPIVETVDADDLERLAMTFSEGLTAVYESESDGDVEWHGPPIDDVTVQWDPLTHNRIAEVAVRKEGYSSPGAISNYADDPDRDPVSVPGFITDTFQQAFTRMVISYDHYYNPSVLRWTGNAPTKAKAELDLARSNYRSGSTSSANLKAGRGSHFLQDVTQPLHTGMEVEQGSDYLLNLATGGRAIHFQYEDYVRDNWTSSTYKFYSTINGDNGAYTTTDPAALARALATQANQYASTVFYAIAGQVVINWRSTLANLTRASLVEAMRATRASVRYMKA